jgi:alanyl-tRNA synthetase
VEGFDWSPCGGTHPHRTGEIGIVKVLHWEKYKSGTRIEFVCGHRALSAIDNKQQILRELVRVFGTGETELAATASKLLQDRKELERNLQEAKQQLLQHEAHTLKEHAKLVDYLRVTAEAFEDRSMQELQRLAGLLTATPNRIALLASVGDKTNLVFAKSEDVELSMVDLLRNVLPLIDGKGGGNASIAQGGGNATGNPRYLLDEALRHIAGLVQKVSHS